MCLTLVPALASAQSSINKIVDTLEDEKNVENVLYSEQRDLSTKKVVKSSRIIKFTSDKLAAKLITAFKKERENALSYQAVSKPSHTVYEISFNDGNGLTSKYTLVQQGGANWILSVSIINSAKTRTRKTSHRTSTRNIRSSRSQNTGYQIIETTTFSDPDTHLYLSMLNDLDTISVSDLIKSDTEDCENGDILVAKETDSGCETYIISNNASKAKADKVNKKSKRNTKTKYYSSKSGSKSSKHKSSSSFSKSSSKSSSSKTATTNQSTIVYHSPTGEVTYIRYK